MKPVRYLWVAAESIVAHKMRAVLTMLGIIIGVAAVLTTLGIGSGAAANITNRIASQGTNLLNISPGASSSGGVRSASGSARTLAMGDVQALANKTFQPDVALIAPQYSSGAQLVNGIVNSQNQVVGTTASYQQIRNLTVASGTFLTDAQVTDLSQVVVLGSTLAQDLFGGVDPVGQTIMISSVPFQVVGVLATSGGTDFNSPDNQAFVPIGVAQGIFNAPRYRGQYTVTSISVTATSEATVNAAELEVEQTLRLRHGLAADTADDFSIFSQTSLLQTLSSVTGTLTIFLGAIGAISLLVGGIGIMNIMLVSVTERTREIGLRRALGAHDSDVLLQFIEEALVLTTLGGLIGMGLSFGVAWALEHVPGFTFNVLIEPYTLVLALGVSAASGLIFGLYPAMRATRLDPIEALRYE